MDAGTFVYRDAKMAEIAAQARKAACGPANILIEGAPGTGRSTLAQYIHGRAGQPCGELARVHCTAGPRPGWLSETAAGTHAGVLLVDVCELDAGAQAELALALGAGHRGGTRIIATASRPLAEAVRSGAFREDLYYRLGVIRFCLPALAERRDDLPVLAAHFADRFARAHGRPARPVTADALEKLGTYHWPGHVQELENVVQRAVLFAEGEAITAGDLRLPEAADTPEAETLCATLVGRTMADVERNLILLTLRHCGGNRTQAAEILGISVRTLRNKIRQYLEDGADVPAFSRAA